MELSKEKRLHSIVESLVNQCRDWIPCDDPNPGEFRSWNGNLPPVTRTKLAFLEENLRKADDILKEK